MRQPFWVRESSADPIMLPSLLLAEDEEEEKKQGNGKARAKGKAKAKSNAGTPEKARPARGAHEAGPETPAKICKSSAPSFSTDAVAKGYLHMADDAQTRKRVHSNVWHRQRAFGTSQGLPKPQVAQLAGENDRAALKRFIELKTASSVCLIQAFVLGADWQEALWGSGHSLLCMFALACSSPFFRHSFSRFAFARQICIAMHWSSLHRAGSGPSYYNENIANDFLKA